MVDHEDLPAFDTYTVVLTNAPAEPVEVTVNAPGLTILDTDIGASIVDVVSEFGERVIPLTRG